MATQAGSGDTGSFGHEVPISTRLEGRVCAEDVPDLSLDDTSGRPIPLLVAKGEIFTIQSLADCLAVGHQTVRIR